MRAIHLILATTVAVAILWIARPVNADKNTKQMLLMLLLAKIPKKKIILPLPLPLPLPIPIIEKTKKIIKSSPVIVKKIETVPIPVKEPVYIPVKVKSDYAKSYSSRSYAYDGNEDDQQQPQDQYYDDASKSASNRQYRYQAHDDDGYENDDDDEITGADDVSY